LVLSFFCVTSNCSAAASAPGLPAPASWQDYKIGDVATEEIIAPIPMVVIDPEETITLKQTEAGRVPVLCRYYTNTAAEVETHFRSVFATTRSNFLEAVETAFNRPVLSAQDIASPNFERLTATFQKRNKLVPVGANLAEVWAQGESDRVIQASLAARLLEAMARPIRAGGNAAPKLTFTVRLVALASPDEALKLEDAEPRAQNIPRTSILSLPKARTDLLESFPPEEQPVGKFLASLLRTNCEVDAEWNRQARAKRTDPIFAADRYEAGQVIVRPGQVVDRKIKLALNQLREKAAIASLQERMQSERLSARQADARHGWVLAGLGAAVVVLLTLLGWLARRKPTGSLLPATVPRAPGEIMALPGAGAGHVRERLIPHLARLLMGGLVQKLISQRTGLLDTQKRAAAEMTELEDRLEKVHAPLQDRLRAYQQRIAELEKELATKGEENRELTKAKIELARKQLAATQDRLGFN
jgi:hypothetical protein